MEKAFGGAKVIYVARDVRKESKQNDDTYGDEIPRPYSTERGDLIDYYASLMDVNSYHARCLTVKVDCTVGLGMSLVEASDTGFDQAVDVVNEDGQSLTEVLERVALDLESTGNGHLEIVRGAGGAVVELYHMPAILTYRRHRSYPDRVLYRGTGGNVYYPMYRPGETQNTHSVLSFAAYTNVDRHYGLPHWRGCVPDIELDHYAVLYNQRFFINSGIPDLAIVVEGGEFDAETEKQVMEFLQGNFKGVLNAHRTLYLPVNSPDVKVRFEKLAVDQKNVDMSFDNLRARCRDNIIAAHGVPPRLVGVVSAGQLGGGGEVQGQLKTFQEITIWPKQNWLATKLTPVIQEMGFKNATLRFESMDTSIQESNSEYYPKMVTAGILGVNEAREDIGLSPKKEEEKPPEKETDIVQQLELIRKSL